MSYDPNRTTALPPVGYPITEEIPVIGPGRRRSSGPFFLKLVGGLLVVGLVSIAAILVIDDQRSNGSASVGTTTTESATPTVEPDANPAPTAVELDDVAPGFWQVVGVADGLNVRSGPGVNNDIVGSLSAGDRHIFGTGERSAINGAEWTQITFGASDTTGWVSSRFLAADTAPDPNAPEPTATTPPNASTSIVCFESQRAPTRIARLQFADRTAISGLIRRIDGQNSIDQTVSGTLANGRAQVTLTNVSSNVVVRQDWIFGTSTVDLGNGTVLSVVECSTVVDRLP